MKTDQWVGRGLPLILMAMIGLIVWLNAENQDKSSLAVACADLTAGCTARVAGREVGFGTNSPIQPLKAFQLWARAPGAKKVEARFTMEGMDMGFNLYTLRDDGEGVFRASATLPVCVTGRRDWRMTLDIDGVRLTVPFVTDL